MKKLILLLTAIFSMAVFGISRTEGLGNDITSQINFFMSIEDLEKSVKKSNIFVQDGIYYYEGLKDPIGIQREVASFMVYEGYGIVSSVFSSMTSEAQHQKIVNEYKEFFKNVPSDKLAKVTSKKGDTILYYNDKFLLQVKRYHEAYTYITVQINDGSSLKHKIDNIEN